jgi:hypothetical protein
MVSVGLYIYIDGVAKRVELFNDEKISVTSSVQDISDISKVRTDFSQSFTVPASENNNRIFSHWYNNSVDNGYDARKRKDAYIELDTILFRKGKIQLEKASVKDNKPENYTLTFYGSLVSLKDTFAGKKLFDLDFSDYNITYSGSEVVSRVSGGVTNDVKFPLISSNRVWQSTGTTDNITLSAWAIDTTELFPALRLPKVFDAIASNYGITFQGDFLTDARFTNAFLYLKNAEKFITKSSLNKINFNSAADFPVNGWEFSVASDVLGYTTPTTFRQSFVTLDVTTTVANINYSVLVYKNGSLYVTVPCPNPANTTNTFDLISYTTNTPANVGTYEFYIQSENILTFTSELVVDVISFASATATQSTSQTTSAVLNIGSYMPDIKVEDFFSGVLKMFNLTCLSYEENVYQIQELESWYEDGSITDITPYVISDDLTIDRLQSFKKINFKYEKSESFMNVAFASNNGVEYGNLLADIDSDGGEYNVSLPFEDMLFNKFTGQNLQVGFALKQDFKNYQPKPMILYDYGTLQSCNFYMKYGVTTTNLTTYNAFGQDTLIGSTNYSLNFGNEISSLLLTPIENSLYNVYYYNYLSNIYNLKTRKYSLKAMFPISLLTKLRLNDRVIIRDTRYLIDNMNIDLTSGEVNLSLINDFRTV